MFKKNFSGTDFDAKENLVEPTNTIVRDELHLILTPEVSRFGSCRVYHVIGQHMITVDSNDITIDVSHLKNGIYDSKNALSSDEPLKFLKSS